MAKERLDIMIDLEVKHKCKKLGLNFTSAINNFLRNYAADFYDDENSENLMEIEREIDEINKKLLDLNVKKTSLVERKEAIMLAIEERRKEKDEEAVSMMKGIKASGLMGRIG